MLSGYTPPLSPSGRSALVPRPPWHYAGTVASISYALDGAAAQAFLPDGFGPATGHAVAHFCEWQATTDGSELLDPVYAQYKECFVLLEAEREGRPALYCPLIYVDQDVSLLRGWLQGLPKKLGSVWLTRPYDLPHPAAAPPRAGTRLGASLSVKDRRLAQAELTLDGAAGRRLGFLAGGLHGLDAFGPGAPRVVRMRAEGHVFGPFHRATAALEFFASPRDELHLLAPTEVGEASIGTAAFTVTGLEGRP
jgi:hypothetical protein